MKIAILHNYLDNIGGAEMVTLTLAREFSADVYTTNIDHDKIRKMGFTNISIRSIGQVPKNAPLRQQLASWLFRHTTLPDDYDLFVIAGDWAVSASVKNKPCVWYVHSPIREIWDSYEYVRNEMLVWWKRSIFDGWVHFNRHLNRNYVDGISSYVCNSRNTQQRLRRYLGKESVVIHPPVATSLYRYGPPQGYWLSVNRLIPHKRIPIQFEAFRKMPGEKLILVGSYEHSKHFLEHKRYLESIKPPNVEVRHWASAEELRTLYAHCTGFITTARDEDFGLTPVEAMASGKPVIAPNEGGYRETVTPQTGVLIDDLTPDALAGAVNELRTRAVAFAPACRERARQFDTAVFVARMREVFRRVTRQKQYGPRITRP